MPPLPPPMASFRLRHFTLADAADVLTLKPVVLAVEELPAGVLLGHVGFSRLDEEVEVSLAIAEAARRQGLGAEALRLGREWVAEAFGPQTLLALTAVDNAASRRTRVSRYGWQRGAASEHGGRRV